MDEPNKSEDSNVPDDNSVKIEVSNTTNEANSQPVVNDILPPDPATSGSADSSSLKSEIEAEELAVQEMVEPTSSEEKPSGEAKSEETNNDTQEQTSDVSQNDNESVSDNVVEEPEQSLSNEATTLATGSIALGAVDSSPEKTTNDAQVSTANPENENKPVHRNNKKLAVFVTIFVTLILSLAVVYVYISAEDNTNQVDSGSQQQNAEQATTDETPASPEDVDQITSEIDQTINSIDDNADFNQEATSDENLGLN